MDVSENRGTPKMDGLEWKNPIKMDDLGVPLFSENILYGFTGWVVFRSSFCFFHPPFQEDEPIPTNIFQKASNQTN